jgi:hypothetical protein
VIPKYCPQCAGPLEERRLRDEQLPQPVCTRCGRVLWQNPLILMRTWIIWIAILVAIGWAISQGMQAFLQAYTRPTL